MFSVVVGSVLASVSGKPDGMCGYECTSDSACGGCGTAGFCSCPDGNSSEVSFSECGCSCVSAPINPPAGDSDISDSVWPNKWTADVAAWSYGDFSHNAAEAHGKFYFDGEKSRSRADWTPYTNGKNAKQVWLADMAKKKSKYYVKSGPLCLYFPIKDHGWGDAVIGLEHPNWMKRCDDAGYAHFLAREQVNVNGKDEWADHWSCRLEYEAVNQTITFQNWHSLGKGDVPKGLPVRVTGGNSAPNPTQGSPRLNTVWYENFVVGDDASKDKDFRAPNFGIFCIPVGTTETKQFFGHTVTSEHVFTPQFHQRAHFFPHARPSSKDLKRAKQPKPGKGFAGASFRESMQSLNRVLTNIDSLTVKNCSEFSLDELHATQLTLFNARSPALDNVYSGASDTRRMVHEHLASMQNDHQQQVREAEQSDLASKVRDGVCHETVMWYVHHLTETARQEVHTHIVLPLLPEVQHVNLAPGAEDAAQNVHERYNAQISCAICHVSAADDAISV